MELLIMRHGEAATLADTDKDRPLTENGRLQADRQARDLQQQIADIGTIFCSPYLRARQTAAAVIRALHYQGELTVSEKLTPDANVADLDTLVSAAGADRVLLISHQPFVGRLIAWLTDREELSRSMGTATVACIELPVYGRGCGTLKWQQHAPQILSAP